MRPTSAAAGLVVVVLAGPAGAQPPPLSILDVPFISQSEALCGGAAAAMVLRYWGARGIDAEAFAPLVDGSAAGIRSDALIDDLRRRGWTAVGLPGTLPQLIGELARGRPVIALIEDRPGTFHYIVVVAATDDALVFHDPARAPMRVTGRDQFFARWEAARRWMAVVVPGDDGAVSRPAAPAGPAMASAAMPPCEAEVAEGVRLAQAGDLDAAERILTRALSCPTSAVLRELAGVRVLQQRWADVAALAEAAVQRDPNDAHAWRMLATSRFVQDDRRAALEAWNAVGEPQVDLLRVAGLVRTRQRVVEQLVDVSPGMVLTPGGLALASRRLQELPAAASTRLTYVPSPGGLAELRATVDEHPLLPRDRWSYAAIGLTAAARREVEIATGALSGGGERLTAAWRFWAERPRVRVAFEAPAPWGGVWGLDGLAEREVFDAAGIRAVERGQLGVGIRQWIAPTLRVSLRGRVEREELGNSGSVGAAVAWRALSERIDARVSYDVWGGARAYRIAGTDAVMRSRGERRGWVLVARGGAGWVSGAAPFDRWLAGDTGLDRATPLRAHPVVAEGRLRMDRLGRRLTHGSLEGQHWWPVSVLRAGVALFVDAARTAGRRQLPARGDVDIGAGARLAVPGLRGTFRADYAQGLADGARALSFVYEP